MKGHIKKRSKQSWSIWIDLGRDGNGRRRQKCITVRGRRKDAERELARIVNEIETGAFVEPSHMTVATYLKRWLDHARNRVSPKTHERYAELSRTHITPRIGSYKLSQLKPLHIQELYSYALEKGRKDGRGGLSPQTVVHIHRLLRAALQQAVRWQLLARNPADAVDPPRPPKTEMKALTEAETAALLRVAEGSSLYLPILVAVVTGLRRGELLSVRWSDIEFGTGETSIQRTLEQTSEGLRFKEPKTQKASRTVTIPAIAVDALKAHKVHQAERRLMLGPAYEDHGLVFARDDGSPWPPDTFSTAFAVLIRRSSLPHVRFHDLRHSHASQLLRQGVHPKVVSERLGHSSVKTTLDIYSHVVPGMQHDAAVGIDRAMRQAINNEDKKKR
jgi:integrase